MVTENVETYWGINDPRELSLSPEDTQLIMKNMVTGDSYESHCSYHEDQEMNKLQGATLVSNMAEKQQELLDNLFVAVIGKIPGVGAREKHLTVMRAAEESVFRYICWRGKPLVMVSKPITYIKNSRYFLRWYWKRTHIAEKRIQRRHG